MYFVLSDGRGYKLTEACYWALGLLPEGYEELVLKDSQGCGRVLWSSWLKKVENAYRCEYEPTVVSAPPVTKESLPSTLYISPEAQQ